MLSVKKAFNRRTYGISNLLFLAVIVLFVPANAAYGAPSITYNSPASDNTTTTYNWVYVSITSNETLNQSVFVWGNASGLNNISMFNASLDNLTWFVNMTGLSAGAYNYTVFAQNTSGEWNPSARRFVTVSAISACQDITVGNVSYILIQNVNSSGTCFNILANNVTIDGAGYTINYSQSATGYAVNSSGYNNTVIKNISIVQESTISGSYAIYAFGMGSGTISNNTIQTVGPNSAGISIESSSNANTVYGNRITTSGASADGLRLNSSNSTTVSDNNITALGAGAYGMWLMSSAGNIISGGSISAKYNDYYLNGTGTNNTFRNTNFTAARNISFFDATSFFNYNNETSGGIWLRTNVSLQTTLTRTLVSLNNNLLLWNDTNSTGVVANYNITGLLANTSYYIYNTSAGTITKSYNLTSDTNGGINFTIALKGNTEIAVERPLNITVNSPPNGSFYNDSALSALVLNITTNEPAAWCGFSLNGTANVTMNGTLTSWNYTGISGASEGLNNITFFCNDSRGNIGTSATRYFTKDNIAPTIDDPPVCVDRTTSSIKVIWNVSNATNNYIHYKNDGSSENYSVASGGSTPQITPPDISSRHYTYHVVSCDSALNCVQSDESVCSKTLPTTTTDDSTTGGSTGGDSSSGLAKSWVSISAGATAVMPVSSSSVDVTEIIFKATQALSRAKITVAKLSGRPSSTSSISSGSVYQYVSITPENITSDKITSATISFRVNSTWISSNAIDSSTITLYRYSNSQWTAIPTHYISTSGGFATYLAETPGFSYFAIVGNPKSAPKPPAVPTVVHPTSYNITNQSNPSSNASFNITAQNNNSTSIKETVSDSTSSLIFIIIAAFVIISALVYYNKKPKSAISTAFSKKPAYTFKQQSEKKNVGDLVYKAPPKEEKVKYAYKPKK